MKDGRGWRNESHRHALAARGIGSRGDNEPIRVDPPAAMYIWRKPIYWIYKPDHEYGYDEYVLMTDIDDESTEFAKVSQLKDGRWAAFPGIPHGPSEIFDTMGEAQRFVIRYYSQVDRLVSP